MNLRQIAGLLGGILLLGTAGASDFSNIPMSQLLVQLAVSALLIAIGCTGKKRGGQHHE